MRSCLAALPEASGPVIHGRAVLYSRVVGGVNQESPKRAAELYGRFVRQTAVTGTDGRSSSS